MKGTEDSIFHGTEKVTLPPFLQVAPEACPPQPDGASSVLPAYDVYVDRVNRNDRIFHRLFSVVRSVFSFFIVFFYL